MPATEGLDGLRIGQSFWAADASSTQIQSLCLYVLFLFRDSNPPLEIAVRKLLRKYDMNHYPIKEPGLRNAEIVFGYFEHIGVCIQYLC